MARTCRDSVAKLRIDWGLRYEYRLDDLVPSDHIVRKLDAALNLGGLRAELTPFYGPTLDRS
jgi:hypothetical protein